MIAAASAQTLTDSLADIETHAVALAAALTRYDEAMAGAYRATYRASGFTAAEGLDAAMGGRQRDILLALRLKSLGVVGLFAAARATGAVDEHWGDRLRERIAEAAAAEAA